MTHSALGGEGHPQPVFPDWSPYADLESAARAYLRDPDLALDALLCVLPATNVLTFTLERFVNEVNCVWQEVAVCDGSRLILWHGEDLVPGDGPVGSMTSSIRVVPLSQVAEVGMRHRLERLSDGALRVDAVDVYVLLASLDDAGAAADDHMGPPVRQDALRFVKTRDDGGPGQINRLEEFARTVSALIGRPI
jgi:hypothetical protein